MKQILHEITEFVPEDVSPDTYGEGDYINNFEQEIAELLGKEKAIFLPSGTMGQQIALRVWCEHQQNFTVAMHPTAHLEFAEHLSYQYLHRLKRVQFGAPETVTNRLLSKEDFVNLKVKPGVILLELPQRVIGYQLPEWDELIAITSWAKEKNIPLHLDGARLWEIQPYYEKPLSTIAQLFDTVYVSFYKGLGGICGAAIAGSEKIIEEIQVWQRRMGGNLVSQFPFIASAKMQIETRLGKMEEYFEYAKQIAMALSDTDLIDIVPNIPQSNSFRVFFRIPQKRLIDYHIEFAKENNIWLLNKPKEALIPNNSTMEVVIGDNALKKDINEWVDLIDKFVNGLTNLD